MPDPYPHIFHGKRVRLAHPQLEDASIVSQMSDDGEYRRWEDTSYARGMSEEEARQLISQQGQDGKSILFHLRTIPEDTLIGFVALHSIEWNNQVCTLSIGIWDAAYLDKGYGSEATGLALNYAFYELNMFRVGLDVIANNTRAIRVYEKNGFREEGRLRQAVYRDGKRVDQILMGILREEYIRRNT